jgi:hypothetical protein
MLCSVGPHPCCAVHVFPFHSCWNTDASVKSYNLVYIFSTESSNAFNKRQNSWIWQTVMFKVLSKQKRSQHNTCFVPPTPPESFFKYQKNNSNCFSLNSKFIVIFIRFNNIPIVNWVLYFTKRFQRWYLLLKFSLIDFFTNFLIFQYLSTELCRFNLNFLNCRFSFYFFAFCN